MRTCKSRSKTALSDPVVVPNGYKANGVKRFAAIRTSWKDADSGICQYATTDEGKSDKACDGCQRKPDAAVDRKVNSNLGG